MTSAILDIIKRPLLVGISSGLCFTAVALLWVKFPFLIPLGILVVVGIAGGVTFLVCETIVLLRVAKLLLPPGSLVGEIHDLTIRAFVGLAVTLIVCNGVLLYVFNLRPSLGWVIAVNLCAVVSCFVARLAAERYMKRGKGGSGL